MKLGCIDNSTKDQSVNELFSESMSNGGVCRRAPATPSLLTMLKHCLRGTCKKNYKNLADFWEAFWKTLAFQFLAIETDLMYLLEDLVHVEYDT